MLNSITNSVFEQFEILSKPTNLGGICTEWIR